MEGVGRRPCDIEERWILSICSASFRVCHPRLLFPLPPTRLLSSSPVRTRSRVSTLERHASFSHPLSRFRSTCTCFSLSRSDGEGAHYGELNIHPLTEPRIEIPPKEGAVPRIARLIRFDCLFALNYELFRSLMHIISLLRFSVLHPPLHSRTFDADNRLARISLKVYAPVGECNAAQAR